jgi:beta-lactamase regulating signal transducer with metallopeptidase domain
MGEWAMGLLSRAELVALGWTLLHFCWQGTVVAVLFALVDRLTVRTASRVRYAVAVGAMFLMPLMVSITFAVEMQAPLPEPVLTTASHVYGVEPHTAVAQPVSAIHGIADRGATLAMRAEQLLPWVDGAWLMGVLMLALRALGGWLYLDRLRRQARGIVPAHLEQSFQRMRARIEVGRRVVLRVSDEVISPLAMGVWRATIIVPASAVLRLSSEELEAVLAHELGHIRRWDYVCNLMQITVESVLFFHPAVWWVSRTVRDRREVCCDEIAVASCADAVVYARALLRLEEQKVAELRFATALAGQRGSLLGRIEKVLGEDRPMVSGMTGGVRVMVAGAVVVGLLLGPKVSDAVAASRPMVEHVAALLPAAISATVNRNMNGADAVKRSERHSTAANSAQSLAKPEALPEMASLRVSEQAAFEQRFECPGVIEIAGRDTRICQTDGHIGHGQAHGA